MTKIGIAGFVAAAILSLAGSTAANATLLAGNTVNYQYYFPDLSTPYAIADNGNKLVGPGIEISNIDDGRGTIDLSDTNVFVAFTSSANYNSAVFNGFVISDFGNSIPSFTGVTVNGATNMAGFSAANVTFDADHIYVNWQGLSFTTDTRVSLDISGPVLGPVPPVGIPEPLTLSLFGAGLAGAFMVRRRRQKAA